MREDVEFLTEDGVTLRGWRYRPDAGEGPFPTIVMAHGFSAVKEMYLDAYAEVFAAAGLGALVFDNRGFGASDAADGEPRQEIDPWRQVRDYRDAITWVSQQADVDAERIGVWGSSYSGGHVLVLAATDRRIRCAVAQVPLISGFRNLQRLVRADFAAPTRQLFDEDRASRYAGKEAAVIPVVDEDPLAQSALPTPDSYRWFTTTAQQRAPSWRNEITLRSVELLGEYDPETFVPRISPTPLCMVVAAGDHLTPSDLALAAYEQAREPKRLVLLPGGHFDAYLPSPDGDFDVASAAARDWFVEHLGPQRSATERATG